MRGIYLSISEELAMMIFMFRRLLKNAKKQDVLAACY